MAEQQAYVVDGLGDVAFGHAQRVVGDAVCLDGQNLVDFGGGEHAGRRYADQITRVGAGLFLGVYPQPCQLQIRAFDDRTQGMLADVAGPPLNYSIAHDVRPPVMVARVVVQTPVRLVQGHAPAVLPVHRHRRIGSRRLAMRRRCSRSLRNPVTRSETVTPALPFAVQNFSRCPPTPLLRY